MSCIPILARGSELDAVDRLHRVERRVEAVEHVVELVALGHAHDAQLVLLAEPDDEPTV